MRTLIDIRDEEQVWDGCLPDPGTVDGHDDSCVLTLRAVELRMSFRQAVSLDEAMRRLIFQPRCHIDLNDPFYCDGEELEKLRLVLRAVMAGKVGRTPVPQDVADAVSWKLGEAKINPEGWQTLLEALRKAREEIDLLQAELKVTKARKQRRKGAGG